MKPVEAAARGDGDAARRTRRDTGDVVAILPAKSTLGGGWTIVLVGVATLVGGAAGAALGEETTLGAVSLLVASGLLGVGLVRAGQLLIIPKGGVSLDRSSARLRLRGAGSRDVLEQPTDELTAVRLVPRDEEWGRDAVRNWSCELERRGCAIAVAESNDYEALWAVARKLEDELGLPLREQPAWSPAEGTADEGHGAPQASPRRVRARAGGRLHATVAALGAVGVAVGAAAMSQVASSPIFGFVFGPTVLFLGLAFTGVALSARMAVDEIEWDEEAVRHRRRLGNFAWGESSLPRTPGVYLRIHHRGLRGADLEAVGARQTLVLVGAVTCASGLGYGGLRDLGDGLASALSSTAARAATEDSWRTS